MLQVSFNKDNASISIRRYLLHFHEFWNQQCWFILFCSLRKRVLRNFAKFTGKSLCQSLFLNKVAGLRPAILLKKSLWHRCFPVNFAKFLRTPFLQNISGRLLLYFEEIIKNDFTQLRAEWLNANNYFPGSQTNIEIFTWFL